MGKVCGVKLLTPSSFLSFVPTALHLRIVQDLETTAFQSVQVLSDLLVRAESLFKKLSLPKQARTIRKTKATLQVLYIKDEQFGLRCRINTPKHRNSHGLQAKLLVIF